MICLEKRAVRLALSAAQMHGVDAGADLPGHDRQIVVGAGADQRLFKAPMANVLGRRVHSVSINKMRLSHKGFQSCGRWPYFLQQP